MCRSMLLLPRTVGLFVLALLERGGGGEEERRRRGKEEKRKGGEEERREWGSIQACRRI
jgi:hypothetical protein